MKIGIIKEGKTPVDTRVAIPPEICRQLVLTFGDLEIEVQSSPQRCFSDLEYATAGFEVKESVKNADILLGVKEVPVQDLISGKTYLFFSHTLKKQDYNRELLRSILQKKIRLIDYECLSDQNGIRVIAFGRFAGIVGAHNGLFTWGKKTGKLQVPRIHLFRDLTAATAYYSELSVPPLRILVTGNGRVAKGAVEVLNAMGIKKVKPEEYLDNEFDEPIFVQLDCDQLYRKPGQTEFDFEHFFKHSDEYESIFLPYTRATDLMINAIYWDPKTPPFFSILEMCNPDYKIQVIADITCDIAPDSSIPSTIRPSSIAKPVYGFDPVSSKETTPYSINSIDMMAVDNLPNELPRDASIAFGKQMLDSVFTELIKPESEMIKNATIAENGKLTEKFSYLQDYVDGRE